MHMLAKIKILLNCRNSRQRRRPSYDEVDDNYYVDAYAVVEVFITSTP